MSRISGRFFLPSELPGKPQLQCIYVLQFLHSSVGHLGCFHVLATVKSASVNIEIYVSFCIMIFSRYILSSEIAGSYGSLTPSFFKESPYCSPQWPYQFTFPLTEQENLLFCTSSPTFIVCRFLYDGHSDWCEEVSHFALLICISLIMRDAEHLFRFCWFISVSSLEKSLISKYFRFLTLNK